MSPKKQIFLVALSGYDTHQILAVFDTERAALEYKLTVPSKDGLESPEVESYEVNAPLNRRPGLWRVWWRFGAPRSEKPFWISMTPDECRKQFRGRMVGLSTDKQWVIASATTEVGALQAAERAIHRKRKPKTVARG